MPQTANEKLFQNFVIHRINLEKVKLSVIKDIMQLQKRLRNDLIAEVSKVDPTSPQRKINQLQRTKKLIDQANAIIDEGYKEIDKRMNTELKGVAALEAEFSRKVINQAIGIEIVSVSLSSKMLTEIVSDTLIQGAASSEWWKRQDKILQNKFADTIRMHMLRGSPLNDIVRSVGGTREMGYNDGIMPLETRKIESLIRTSVQAVANKAAENTFKANDDVLEGFIWISTLDEKTTIMCAVRDHLVYDFEHNPVGHNIPWLDGPGRIHWQCRSCSLPKIKPFEGIPRKKQEEIFQKFGKRASKFGQIPDVNFEEWLKDIDKKHPEITRQILGSHRAELWRKSKLSIRDMVGGDGKPITIKALKDKYEKEWDLVFNEPEKFIPAKNIREAEDWAIKTGIAKKANYEKLPDVEFANAINEHLYDIKNDINEVYDEIVVKNQKNKWIMSNVNDYKNNKLETSKLEINANAFHNQNLKSFDNSIKKLSDKNWTFAQDISGLIDHEIGHKLTFPDQSDVYLKLEKLLKYVIIKDEEMSGYGKTHGMESLAEIYTYYKRHGKEKVPEKWIEFFNKYSRIKI